MKSKLLPIIASVAATILLVIVGSGPGHTRVAQAAVPAGCWNSVPSPSVGFGGRLKAVEVVSANDVWAVGYFIRDGGDHQTFTMHWNGTTWNHVPSPNPGPFYNDLNAVSAVSSNDVWAVGNTYDWHDGHEQTISMHWDGTAWSAVPTPNVRPDRNVLLSVTAISANDVWAVGFSGDLDVDSRPTDTFTLGMHWNGTAWQVVPTPNDPRPNENHSNQLSSVDAVGTNEVWAVGSGNPGGTMLPFIERWDGSTWSVVPSPVMPEQGLWGVGVRTANDVWAVGGAGGSTLIEHWDGTAWNEQQPEPFPYPGIGVLYSVSARAANDVWAVGAERFGSGAVIVHWDGTEWSEVPISGSGSELNGVAAVTAGDVWAVGYAGELQPLVMHYSDPCTGSGTPTVTPTSTATAVCTGNYGFATATATVVPGTTDTGNHCDDCTVPVTFPFPYTLYGQTFTTARASSNGNLQFVTADAYYSNSCLPYPFVGSNTPYAIVPYWDDLHTTDITSGKGVFTSITGTAPNRIFNIEWRASRSSSGPPTLNFEVRLYEGQTRFEIIYGTMTGNTGSSATIGVQKDMTTYTQFSCNSSSITDGTMIISTLCVTSSPTNTPANTATVTFTSIPTDTTTRTPTTTPTDTPIPPTNTPTETPSNTVTRTPTETPTNTPSNTPTQTPTNTVVPATNTPVPPATGTAQASSTSVMSTDVPKTIADGGTTSSEIIFGGERGGASPKGFVPFSAESGNEIITGVEVLGLDISEPAAADLDVYLVSPAGSMVELFTDVCSGNAWNSANTGFTLSDGAQAQIGSTCPPGRGSYRPEASLSRFVGQSPQGTWRLLVTDDRAGGGAGTLNAWGLRITTAPGPGPCNSCSLTVESVTITCNPDGTVHWATTVRNSSSCSVSNIPWGAELEVRRGTSQNYIPVRGQSGTRSFPPGPTTLTGDFCYPFPPDAVAMRARFGMVDRQRQCLPNSVSASSPVCALRPSCQQ